MRRLLIRSLAAAHREAEEDWKVPPPAARAWFVAPILLVPAVALLWWIDRPLLHSLAEEDGLFEWAQVVLFGLGMATAVSVARRLGETGRRAAASLYLGAAAGLFFVAGEELAWGQRFLHFGTPDALAAVNEKAEVSIHNIRSIEAWFTFAKLVAGAYGAFGAWVLMRWGVRHDPSPWRLFVVPAYLSSPFLVVLAMRALRLTAIREALPAGYSELEELFLAWGSATFLRHARRILPRPGGEGPGAIGARGGGREPGLARRAPETADRRFDGGPPFLPGDLPGRPTGL
ncbi:MAG TPA: hypothetical protein VKF62_12550 [Planctomycetota bacterium]|nr:hypothetical protein [Planctomycetota bacterium]